MTTKDKALEMWHFTTDEIGWVSYVEELFQQEQNSGLERAAKFLEERATQIEKVENPTTISSMMANIFRDEARQIRELKHAEPS